MTEQEPHFRSGFQRFEAMTARWNDLDIFGHLNNAVFYELFDTAILRLLVETGAIERQGKFAALVVTSGAVFHREVLFEDRIEVGIRVNRIGRTSVTYELGLFTEGRADSAVDGRVVHVFVDRAESTPVPIPEAARALFETLANP